MATLESIGLDLNTPEAKLRPSYRRLGLINGLLIGLALATGAWGQEALQVFRLPVHLYLPTLLLGAVVVVFLCTLTGWLTTHIAKTWVTVPLWSLAAIGVILTIGYLGTYGRTLVVWLAEPMFIGRNIYPYSIENGLAGLIIGGFLILLVIGLMALLQDYRLGNLVGGLGENGHMDSHTWIGLLWPLPFVFLAALLTKSSLFDPSSAAASLTNEAVTVAQNYDGDLRDLGQVGNISYLALRGVQDQLAGDFEMDLAEVDTGLSTVIVGINFDSGAWINCRVINNQLSQCYDASLPYTRGLQYLLAGEPIPEDCRGCLPSFEDETMPNQLAAMGRTLGGITTIERVAQGGGQVVMRATGSNGRSVDCWFEGVTRTFLLSCTPNTTAP